MCVSAFEPLTAQQPTISAISPTPFFPKQETDKALKQITKMKVEKLGTNIHHYKLPKSELTDQNGIVRISELNLMGPVKDKL
ncbi:hypothetical protein SAMN03080594_10148 [Arenibacter palladensis]|uniref:Uncharacterized protein n=1 Tax=Arenibacter palladensis TaxID=237373 RepID=A0A1M4SW00_9FLAO|nr:hypothetical protein SAMN03080594_10148 [Arenibacter palladensis]